MSTRDIIVVGASSGGLAALRVLVRGLPADLRAAVFIVLHIAPQSPNLLPELLNHNGGLAVATAQDNEPITPGRVYVAPPDRHLLVTPGCVRVTYGPKENRSRPAVDALFRSAANAYGPRVVGVVLTGQLDDGTAGLWAIKDRGGTTIIQDPAEADYPSMPSTARQYVAIDYELPLAQIAPTLARLSAAAIATSEALPMNKELEAETRIAQNADSLDKVVGDLGTLTPYSCPECNGVLLALKGGGIPRFRCHTGHAFSMQSLLADQTEAIERDLWSSARAIQESVLLMRNMAEHLRETHAPQAAEGFEQKALAAEERVKLLRQLLSDHEKISPAKVKRPAARGGKRSAGKKAATRKTTSKRKR